MLKGYTSVKYFCLLLRGASDVYPHLVLQRSNKPASLAQMDAHPSGDQEVTGSIFFRGDLIRNIFYGHSLPSADSGRAVVVSF